MTSHVTLKQIADELGMDKSNARKWILKHGFSGLMVRTRDSGSQLCFAVSVEDAETIRTLRSQQGFQADISAVIDATDGYFYIVQIAPDLDPHRVKLGFANDVSRRLGEYRCLSPTANVVRCWPCQRAWEVAAIASATRTGCEQIGQEVYQCEEVLQVVAQAEDFFTIMPRS